MLVAVLVEVNSAKNLKGSGGIGFCVSGAVRAIAANGGLKGLEGGEENRLRP